MNHKIGNKKLPHIYKSNEGFLKNLERRRTTEIDEVFVPYKKYTIE